MKHCPSRCRRWPARESGSFLRRTLADGLANQFSPAPRASARWRVPGRGRRWRSPQWRWSRREARPHHALAARFLDHTAARVPAHAIAPAATLPEGERPSPSPDEVIYWQHNFLKLNSTIVTTWGLCW